MSGFSNPIAGASGALTIPQLQSPDYVEGVSGWMISKTGNAEFNNVRTRGESYVDGPNGSQIALIDGTTNPALALTPPSVVHQTQTAQVFAFGSSQGAANETCWLVMTSGKENGLADAAVQFISETADGTGPAVIVFEFGGTVAGTWTLAGGLANGPWTTATLSNGWAGSGSGVNGLYYRLTADREIEILFDIQNTTATGNSVCATLPVTPAVSGNQPAAWNNPVIGSASSVPWMFLATSGALQVTGIEAANKPIFGRVKFPLGTL